MLSNKTKGVLLMATGAICFSAKAIIIKLAYRHYPVEALTLLTLRFGYSLPFFAAIVFWRKAKHKFKDIKKKDLGWIALLAILGYYLASWFDFWGLKYISAGLERIILFIYPTLVVLLSHFFLNKKISKIGYIALALTYVGILIIGLEPRIFEAKDFITGGTLILLSAITYAIYLTFGGELIIKYGSINFNSIAMLLSSIYVLIHFWLFSSDSLTQLPPEVHLYGFTLAIVSTVIPTFIQMEGIRLLGANLGAIVGSIGPVSTIILGYYFLDETFSLQELLGSLLILIGVVLIGATKK